VTGQLGVAVGIAPFNFPAMVPMWIYPIALAAGNTFILKPSSHTPGAIQLQAELWKQAGLPDGVFNVVYGGREAVTALVEHPGVDAIQFVGSTAVAPRVLNLGSTGVTVVSESAEHLIATVGLKDLVIVHADDATLVCKKRDAQSLKELIARIRETYDERYL